MASLLPVVHNENRQIHRGKDFNASLTKVPVQNENSYVHKGKGLGKAKGDVLKQSKVVGQERKALSGLKQAKAVSQERRALRDLTNANANANAINTKPSALKEKSLNPSRGTVKKAIVGDDRIGEWAAEGIEKMNFFDVQKFENGRLQDWCFSELFAPFPESPPSCSSEVLSDGEDILKMELEPEVLPPSHPPRRDTILPSILGDDECLDILFEDLYFNRANEGVPLMLKEESELGGIGD